VHCNWLDEDEWKLLSGAGCKVSITPETELGMGCGVPPIRTCIDHGIKPTLGCDITSLNSGDIITQARLGLAYQRYADADPVCLGGMPSALDLTSMDALQWATVNGAEACGLGSRVGTLTEGKQADILLIGGDSPNMYPSPKKAGTVVFQANSSNVRTVLVAGKVRKRDGELVGVDKAGLRSKVERQSAALLERASVRGPVLPEVPAGFLEMMNPVWSGNIAKAKEPQPG
jgi:cytosine/adenosine deaminase-related metal-dependent hydrolase